MGHPPSKILRDLWGFVSMPLQHLQGKRKTQQNPPGFRGYWGWAAFQLRLGGGSFLWQEKGEEGKLPPLLPGSHAILILYLASDAICALGWHSPIVCSSHHPQPAGSGMFQWPSIAEKGLAPGVGTDGSSLRPVGIVGGEDGPTEEAQVGSFLLPN